MRKNVKLPYSLREVSFFEGMSPEAFGHIEAFVHHREYEARQIVYFPDDLCDQVYWVREGRVKVMRVVGDSRELTYRHLLPGDLFGDDGLAGRTKREDYAEALDSTVLCLMSTNDFTRLVHEEVEFASRVSQHLCRRAIEVEQVLADTVFSPVRSRIAAGILRLHVRADTGRALRVTHQEIANLVGTTRETTTGVLHGFRAEGIIEIANRKLRILDAAALEHAARNV